MGNVPSGHYPAAGLGSGLHASPAGSVPPATPSAPEVTGPHLELATQRGLATSSTGRITLPPKRNNALVVGLPLAVLAAGVMIAVAILVSRGPSKEASPPAAAAGPSESPAQAQPAPVIPTPVAAASSAAPVAEAAPSAEPSAVPTEAKTTPRAPVYSRPAAPAKTSETPSKPAGKRPEIRSPFE
jgi:hypothetical protein